jgi:oligopeptide/dipeptide ABC transporter ATP-binding protein
VRQVLKGVLPDPANPPAGCPFHTRCPQVMDICNNVRPRLLPPAAIAGRSEVACHLYS